MHYEKTLLTIWVHVLVPLQASVQPSMHIAVQCSVFLPSPPRPKAAPCPFLIFLPCCKCPQAIPRSQCSVSQVPFWSCSLISHCLEEKVTGCYKHLSIKLVGVKPKQPSAPCIPAGSSAQILTCQRTTAARAIR